MVLQYTYYIFIIYIITDWRTDKVLFLLNVDPFLHDSRAAEHPSVVVDVGHGVGELQLLRLDQRHPGLDAPAPAINHTLNLCG